MGNLQEFVQNRKNQLHDTPQASQKKLPITTEPDDGEWPFRPISEETDSQGRKVIKTYSSAKKTSGKRYDSEQDLFRDMRLAVEEIAGEKFATFDCIRFK